MLYPFAVDPPYHEGYTTPELLDGVTTVAMKYACDKVITGQDARIRAPR